MRRTGMEQPIPSAPLPFDLVLFSSIVKRTGTGQPIPSAPLRFDLVLFSSIVKTFRGNVALLFGCDNLKWQRVSKI